METHYNQHSPQQRSLPHTAHVRQNYISHVLGHPSDSATIRAHQQILISKNPTINPICIERNDDIIVLAQGVNRLTADETMLTEVLTQRGS